MTIPQLRYVEYREQQRHNQTTESLTAQANENQRYGIDVSAETARATAQIAADASKYSADRHYESSVYSADSARAANQYASDQAALTQRYATRMSTAASLTATKTQAENTRYSADKAYAATQLSTASQQRVANVNAAAQERINKRNLAFEREKFAFESSLKQQYLELEQMNSVVQRAHSTADIERIHSQVKNTLVATENILREYALRARQQDNADALNDANVALTKLRTIESAVKSGESAANAITKITSILQEVLQ